MNGLAKYMFYNFFRLKFIIFCIHQCMLINSNFIVYFANEFVFVIIKRVNIFGIYLASIYMVGMSVSLESNNSAIERIWLSCPMPMSWAFVTIVLFTDD